jgi:hypothetical protein
VYLSITKKLKKLHLAIFTQMKKNKNSLPYKMMEISISISASKKLSIIVV